MAEILAERHQSQAAHEPHREVGEERQEEAPVAAAPAAALTPEPVAAPAAAPPASAALDPVDDPKSPRWFREEMKRLRTENQRLSASPQPRHETPPQSRPAAPQAEFPNPVDDPQGYHRAVQAEMGRQLQVQGLIQTLTVSERFARREVGNETFEDCKAWLSTKPQLEQLFLQDPDPWTQALAYYQRERLTEEIGDDPAAYRKRIEDEAIARYQAQQGQQQEQREPAPAPSMRAAPPAPASAARAAAPRDPETGKFVGPSPLAGAFRNKF